MTEKSLYYRIYTTLCSPFYAIWFLRIAFHYLKKFVLYFFMVVSVVGNVMVVIGAIWSHKDVISFHEISRKESINLGKLWNMVEFVSNNFVVLNIKAIWWYIDTYEILDKLCESQEISI